MNYWPAEVDQPRRMRRAACSTPSDDLAESGRETAQAHYGARGWVAASQLRPLARHRAHQRLQPRHLGHRRRVALPRTCGSTTSSRGDRQFLAQRAYPLMKDAALFFADSLVEDPKTGWLISGPSNSPEQGGLVMGPTMDHQIIRCLFGACSRPPRILGTDAEFAAQAGRHARAASRPTRSASTGSCRNGCEDKDNPKNAAPPRVAPVGPVSRLRHHLADDQTFSTPPGNR